MKCARGSDRAYETLVRLEKLMEIKDYNTGYTL